eukprot:Filipodium_phascolosomae@DN2590_c0_g1_i3.p1
MLRTLSAWPNCLYPSYGVSSFFSVLLLLGIDSILGLIQTVISPWVESAWWARSRRPYWHGPLAGVLILLFIISFYCWDTALVMIDQTDWFMSHIILQVGLLGKLVGLSMTYKWRESIEYKNGLSLLPQILLIGMWLGGVIVACIIGLSTKGSMAYIGVGIGAAIAILGVFVSLLALVLIRKSQNWEMPLKTAIFNHYFCCVESLRRDYNTAIQPSAHKWVRVLYLDKFSIVWSVVYKYLLSALLILLLSVDLKSLGDNWNSAKHLIPYKIYGLCLVLVLVPVVILCLVWPENPLTKLWLDPLPTDEDSVEKDDLDSVVAHGGGPKDDLTKLMNGSGPSNFEDTTPSGGYDTPPVVVGKTLSDLQKLVVPV